MPPRLSPYPLLQKRPVPKPPPVRDPSLDLRLARVEAQQRRHAVDHVREAEARRCDVGGVELHLAVGDAALGLAHAAGGDELVEERGDLPAGAAPGGRPEGEEGPAGGGGELEVGLELVLVADAGGGGGSAGEGGMVVFDVLEWELKKRK